MTLSFSHFFCLDLSACFLKGTVLTLITFCNVKSKKVITKANSEGLVRNLKKDSKAPAQFI